MIDRRSFLRLMLASAAAESVDFEKLLWIPKPIVSVPSMTETQIINVYMSKMIPQLNKLFERDDLFYRIISKERIVLEEAKPNTKYRILP